MAPLNRLFWYKCCITCFVLGDLVQMDPMSIPLATPHGPFPLPPPTTSIAMFLFLQNIFLLTEQREKVTKGEIKNLISLQHTLNAVTIYITICKIHTSSFICQCSSSRQITSMLQKPTLWTGGETKLVIDKNKAFQQNMKNIVQLKWSITFLCKLKIEYNEKQYYPRMLIWIV